MDELAKLYLEGVSIGDIAAMRGLAKSTISRRFARTGVKRRSAGEAIRLSHLDSTKYANCGRPKKYIVNESFFAQITPESAYVIGLIQADGTISGDRFSISAKASDSSFLQKVAMVMGSNRPIQTVQHQHGTVSRLAINSTPMADDLKSWGIHTPRTYTASTHVDLLFNRDYWRGAVDGDGSICTSKRGHRILTLVGSMAICDQFLAFCRKWGFGLGVSVHPCKQIFCVRLNGDEAVGVSSLLYRNAGLALPRKMDRYRAFVGEAA